MESFSYSVSHRLRASLRGIDGFSPALEEEYADHLDANARSDLGRIRSGTERMAMLIDDLLNLARVTRAEMHRETIDLTKTASDITHAEPNQQIALKIDGSLAAHGDHRLLPVALQDLLGNACKFTAKRLATIQRIIHRHGRKVWAEGAVNHGATVYFTLQSVGGTEWNKAYAP